MAVFKCKMCGGALEIGEMQSIVQCDYCGTEQTLPRLDDERRANLYDRANHFRRNNEFDKAAGIFEQMLNEDGSDAEAYWSLVLCSYGIEYVEDPATHKRVPTVNRAQFTSVFDDENYKKALENSDILSRTLYEREAAAINELQKGILAISQKEEPFDVFICYKETDNNGRRTPDSVLANDLYHQLTAEGFKVFFSRITLEDKLGSAYEPYIFAALNSAKVMVAIGTRPEYFKAVWVKNEWSRYLALVKQSGGKKVLIPAYRDMDPYDLPDEFSHLQAQDMGKLGFMQDLIRGVKKLTAVEKEPVVKETVVVKSEGGNNLTALLKRGNMALEDGEWDKANGFFEQVLNLDAECAEAYWGMTLAQQRCRGTEELVRKRKAPLDSPKPETLSAGEPDEAAVEAAVKRFTECGYLEEKNIRSVYGYSFGYPSLVSACAAARENEERYWRYDKNLSKAVRFTAGDNRLVQLKQEILSAIDERLSAEKQKDADAAKSLLEAYPAHLRQAEERCARDFEEQHTQRLSVIIEKEQDADALLDEAMAGGQEALFPPATAAYTEAIDQYQKLVPDADISAHIDRCTAQLAKIDATVKELQATAAREKKKTTISSLSSIAAVIVLAILITKVFIPAIYYRGAEKALAAGSFEEARTEFGAAGGYKDAAARIAECHYAEGEELLAEEDYAGALTQFIKAGAYNDAPARAMILWDAVAVRETLSAGKSYTVGLHTDGTAVAVGYNDDGQCAVSGWTDIAAISAGGSHTVGLRADGTAVAVGRNGDGQCEVSDWTDIVAIASGYDYTVGLRADGTVVAAGSDAYGQCAVSGWTDVVAISAGVLHTVGLRSDGTVVAAGSDAYGQCGVSGWTDIVAISAGVFHTVGLRSDGTVVATDYTGEQQFNFGQCDVSGWTDIVAIAAGRDHTVGLQPNGTVVATEYINYQTYYCGQCDVSDWTDIKLPTGK